MSTQSVNSFRWMAVVAAGSACLPLVAAADVTIEQSMRMEGPALMGMLDMDGTVTTSISGNRARTESEVKMKSRLIGMFGGGGRTAEIIQLDAEKFYALDLKKKTYTEMTLAEQRQAIENAMNQMREAQGSQQQGAAGMDSADCEWSEPKAEVERPGDTDTIAGFKAERSVVTATQSCKNPETGSVCDFNLVLDQWLAEDLQAGSEVESFWRTYAEKLGLDVADAPGFAQRLESMFGAYQGIWKEIAEEMQNTGGYPVRTTVSLAIGGPQCDTSQQAQTAGAQAPGANQQSGPGMNESIGGAVGSAVGGDDGIGGAVGNALGGLFGRKRDDAARKKQEQQAAAVPTQQQVDLPDGTVPLMSITSELIRISDDGVPGSAFAVPDNFRKVER